MQTRNRNTFITIHTEGALLPVDLLQRISENDKNLEGLNPESYHLAPGEKLNEAINRSWNRLSGLWGAFQAARGRLGSTDAGTTLARERWLLPLFQELGFGRLSTSKAVEIEGKSYPISHRWQNVPLHLVGCRIELDKRTPGAAGASRTSPHSLMQEYLNRSDDVQWGVISNGLGLRILRDNATLTRQAYIEFDLESMFDGEIYSDFVLLWLICHQSRFETTEKQTECLLEKWSKSAQESGTRALDDLRRGVEEAIVSFGQGFLQHPLNGDLRNRLKNGDLSTQDYYRQLLRLVYRLIFLFAAEDRDLLLLPGAAVEARQRFQNYYSTNRLRALAQRQRGSRHHDHYEALRLVMTLLGSDSGCPELAIPALGGFLFDARSTVDLNEARLDNQALLSAVRSLAFITEGNTRRAVDYRNLGPEELGSVYESLLELHPLLNTDAGTFQLTSAAGNERKTTGSYYTPSSLIQVLLDSALDPVIQDRLKGRQDAVQQEQALLELRVCDPACGSGHFLIAAAHRIAGRLAEVRAGDNEPSPNETRRALRDVIRHCIYGVDINPMAVELCKVNLWLESLEPGKPLSFLDSHIKCGDSLVGIGPGMDISEVPDEAFNPAFGDDKATSSALKKRNKAERAGQMALDIYVIEDEDDLQAWMARRAQALDELPEETVEQVGQKTQNYQEYLGSPQYHRRKLEYDMWTAAFFWKMEGQPGTLGILAPTQEMLRRHRAGGTLPPELVRRVEEVTIKHNFLHWELCFPKVFSGNNPGFDCILGNPPWDMLQLNPQEFFAIPAPEIATIENMSVREKAISKLAESNKSLYTLYQKALHKTECTQKFIHSSQKYPLTSYGRINLMALFAELAQHIVSAKGRSGIIVPTGIATDSFNQYFFAELTKRRSLVSLYDFENRMAIFPGVHRSYKFCLLVTSGSEIETANFAFFLSSVENLSDRNRRFDIPLRDISLLNPNTKTMPIFRTRVDAELTLKIYHHVPILENDGLKESPWGFKGLLMFMMNTDSGLFKSEEFPDYYPLYEAKMIHQFNHRWASQCGGDVVETSEDVLKNPNSFITTKYYVSQKEVDYRLGDWRKDWLLCFRDITNTTNERTVIASFIPRVGVANNAPVFISTIQDPQVISCLLANLNCFAFDFIARQKVGGIHLNFFIFKQLPVLPPNTYSSKNIEYISSRVIELVYTAYDLRPFAEDMGYHGEPFRWDEERRALLRSELDAYYAKLYGLNRDELRYILDPQDVYGPDYPGETFRVLKDKEIRQYGEYRTRRLVLEAWDRLQNEEDKEEVSRPIPIDLPITVETPRNAYADTWVPVKMTPYVSLESLSENFRQAVGVAWELENFGKANSIPLYDAQKFSYFIQRAGLADLEIDYREFARGPYSPQVTYKAGAYAKSASYWEVKGGVNIARGRNMKKAVEAAPRVFSDLDQAYKLVGKLSQLSKEDLGGFATVDFASRAIFERGQAITPENIHGYFQSDWPEKMKDTWYTDANILRALEMLANIGLFQKPDSRSAHPLVVKEALHKEPQPEAEGQTDPLEQPTFSDFGLYKCGICGKMVMGFEKANHEQEIHGSKSVEWKKVR